MSRQPSVKVSFALVHVIKRYLSKEITTEEGAKETGLSTATFWRYANKPLEELYALARETQYEAMTPEQRVRYDATMARHKAQAEVAKAMAARRKLQEQRMQEEHDKAVEEYLKGRQAHIDHKLKTNNKFGNVNLGERKCPICGKTIFIQDKTAWLFKVRYGKGFVYLCSEGCKEKRANLKIKRGKNK